MNLGQVTAAAMEQPHSPSLKRPSQLGMQALEHHGGKEPLCKAGPPSRRGSPAAQGSPPSTAGAWGHPVPQHIHGPRTATGRCSPPRSLAALCWGGAASISHQPRAKANAQLSSAPQETSGAKHAARSTERGENPPQWHFPCPRETSARRKEKVLAMTAKEEAQGSVRASAFQWTCMALPGSVGEQPGTSSTTPLPWPSRDIAVTSQPPHSLSFPARQCLGQPRSPGQSRSRSSSPRQHVPLTRDALGSGSGLATGKVLDPPWQTHKAPG